MSRPREYDRAAIAVAFQTYIESEEIPILAKFASNQGFGKDLLYKWAETDEEFFNLIKKCTTKKEAALEEKGLAGGVNVTMAIFSLKQLGWSDKQEQTLKGDANNPIAVTEVAKAW